MVEIWSLAVAFFFGGVLLTPIIFAATAFILFYWWQSLVLDHSPSLATRFDSLLPKPHKEAQNQAITQLNSRSGWIRMTKEFKVDHVDSNNISGLMMQGINSLIEGKNAGPKRPKNSYFAVLKHETLSLYADEKMLECQGVITLSFYTVSIYPSYLPDNEVFHKELPIRLKKKTVEDDLMEDTKSDYYIFVNTPVFKEDWFFALCRASRLKKWGATNTQFDQNPANFEPTAMRLLIEKVNSDEHHRQTQWLNAFIGRVFLSMYKTQAIKDFMIRKVLLKCTKVKRPSFIKEFVVKDLLLGDNVPSVTHPRLIDLNAVGNMTVEFRVHYSGGFSMEIETELTISMPPLIKTTTIPVKVAVRVRSLEGRMQLKIKSPPTNRLWIGFTEEPNISLDIVPIISGKVIQSTLILKAIERQIRTVLREVIVLPNMDDTPFFPSEGLGGIFDVAGISKLQSEVVLSPQSEPDDADTSIEDNIINREELKTPTEMFEDNGAGSSGNSDEYSDNDYFQEINENLAVVTQISSEVTLKDPVNLAVPERSQTAPVISTPPTANSTPMMTSSSLGRMKSTDGFALEGGLPNVTAVTRGYAMAKNTDLKDSGWWKTGRDLKRNSLASLIPVIHSVEQSKEQPFNDKLGKIKLLPSLMAFRSSTWGAATTSKENSSTSDHISNGQASKANTNSSFANSPTLSSIASIFSHGNSMSTKSSNIESKSNAVPEAEEPKESTPGSSNTTIISSQTTKFFTSLFTPSST
ncbi:hypothetical protein K7432_005458 [Basidiobolus ranarum]|uniref:SMP-LTD domain-containing protein n=1 Tax=Basidiobolus ranarum TaxID=34480 RepID=A0ABR2WWH4_9FUNG